MPRLGACWIALVALVAGIVPGADTDGGADRVRTLINEGRYTDAVEVSRENLAEVEASDDADSLAYAEALDLHVESRWRYGIFLGPETRELAERAVAIKEARLGLEDPGVATSLTRLGSVMRERGDFAEAIEVFDRALAIGEARLNDDDQDLADILHEYGVLRRQIYDYHDSKQMLEYALDIRQRMAPLDDPRSYESACQLSVTLFDVGERVRGFELAESGMAEAESELGGTHSVVGLCAWALGRAVNQTGDQVEAKPLFGRAIEIQAAASGPDRTRLVKYLGDAAFFYLGSGDYEASRSAAERAEAIALESFPDHWVVANLYNGYGNLLRVTGDYEGARGLFERGARIAEKLGPAREGALALAWSNLAYLLTQVGDAEGAGEYFQRAWPVLEDTFGPAHRFTLTMRTLYGELLFRVGEFEEQRNHARRSLETRRATLGPDHPDQSSDWISLGLAQQALGEFDGAVGSFNEALRFLESSRGPESPNVALTLTYLSASQLGAGRHEEALAAALRSERIYHELTRLTVRTLPERQALAYLTYRTYPLYIGLEAAMRGNAGTGKASRQVLDSIIRSRAVVFDEIASRHRRLAGMDDAESGILVDELIDARRTLAQLTFAGPGRGSAEEFRIALDGARERKERTERALAVRSAAFRREQAMARAGLDEVLTSLPPDSALVGFVRFGSPVLHGSDNESGSSESPAQRIADGKAESLASAIPTVPSYVAFVLRAGSGTPELVPLGTQDDLDRLVTAWIGESTRLPAAFRPGTPGAESSIDAAGDPLRRAVWDPIATHLDGVEQVFVVPDGILHLVNLATLPTGDGHYLIETGPLLHHLSAERDLVRVDEPDPGVGLLALGGADFDAAPGQPPETTMAAAPAATETENTPPAGPVYRGPHADCEDFQALRFTPLAGTRQEVDEVTSLWQRNSTAGKDETDEPIVRLGGAAAHEDLLKRWAPGQRVLHLATHGFFVDPDCATGEDSRDDTPVNPLLLSGLALAGANNRTEVEGDVEDGILTAEEIASLDLTGVQWAVLSACDTGVGQVVSGEGILGLRRAFQIAGARTLIMSLWSVQDDAARRWMGELYAARFEGLTTAESVRQASLTILTERREAGETTHPFFWGAFVAAGDWR